MGRIPKVGDFLHSDDVPVIYEAFEEHQRKFPDSPPVVSLAWVLANVGSRFAPVVCVEGEWTGSILDVENTEGDPKCPNGHPVFRGTPLRLSWSQKEYESVDDGEENCDVWIRVDFGHGPAEIRCTQVGHHRKHGCSIQFSVK